MVFCFRPYRAIINYFIGSQGDALRWCLCPFGALIIYFFFTGRPRVAEALAEALPCVVAIAPLGR